MNDNDLEKKANLESPSDPAWLIDLPNVKNVTFLKKQHQNFP